MLGKLSNTNVPQVSRYIGCVGSLVINHNNFQFYMRDGNFCAAFIQNYQFVRDGFIVQSKNGFYEFEPV